MKPLAQPAIDAVKMMKQNLCRSILKRYISIGSKISATGVFHVSCGGDTEFRHSTAMTAVRWLLQRRTHLFARNAENRCNRIPIRSIHGSHRRCGRSQLSAGRKTPELEYFYPTSVLVTGYDIIPFWVMRMMFSRFGAYG